MFWFGTLQQEAIIPCFLVTVFKIKLTFMFVGRNQGTVLGFIYILLGTTWNFIMSNE